MPNDSFVMYNTVRKWSMLGTDTSRVVRLVRWRLLLSNDVEQIQCSMLSHMEPLATPQANKAEHVISSLPIVSALIAWKLLQFRYVFLLQYLHNDTYPYCSRIRNTEYLSFAQHNQTWRRHVLPMLPRQINASHNTVLFAGKQLLVSYCVIYMLSFTIHHSFNFHKSVRLINHNLHRHTVEDKRYRLLEKIRLKWRMCPAASDFILINSDSFYVLQHNQWRRVP